MTRVIGVIGQNGSGKDEVLKYLRDKHGVPFLSTGDAVREIAAKAGIEPTRENLGDVSRKYFDQYGKGCFVKLLAKKIQENGWKIAGISGIRAPEDVTALKDIFGQDFILIKVYISDPLIRFGRMTKRAEGRDPHSYEQFLCQDKTEEELFSTGKAEILADYSISNDGTLEDMHREVEKLISRNKLLKQ